MRFSNKTWLKRYGKAKSLEEIVSLGKHGKLKDYTPNEKQLSALNQGKNKKGNSGC